MCSLLIQWYYKKLSLPYHFLCNLNNCCLLCYPLLPSTFIFYLLFSKGPVITKPRTFLLAYIFWLLLVYIIDISFFSYYRRSLSSKRRGKWCSLARVCWLKNYQISSLILNSSFEMPLINVMLKEKKYIRKIKWANSGRETFTWSFGSPIL